MVANVNATWIDGNLVFTDTSGNELLKIDAANNVIDIPAATLKYTVDTYTADGAIAIVPGTAELAKTSAAAMTIAAPSTAQDGTVILIVNSTAYAHVVTFTGSTLNNGSSAAKTTVTFPAYVGGALRIMALGGKWYAHGYINVTIA